MSSLPREKGYYKERALRRLGELIPRETEAPKEIEENPVGPSREEPDEDPYGDEPDEEPVLPNESDGASALRASLAAVLVLALALVV